MVTLCSSLNLQFFKNFYEAELQHKRQFLPSFIPTQHISQWLPDESSKLKVLLDPARRAETKTNSFRSSLLVTIKWKQRNNSTTTQIIYKSFHLLTDFSSWVTHVTIYFIYCFRLVDNRCGRGFIKEKYNAKCRIVPVLFFQEEMKKRLDAETWTWKKKPQSMLSDW